MRKRPVVYDPPTELSVACLKRYIDGWVLDGEIRQLSDATLYERRFITGKLLWFLADKGLETCGPQEIRLFLGYVARGHTDPRGRWGDPRQTKPVAPRTALAYFRVLRCMFAWVEEEHGIAESPLDGLKAPIVRTDQVQPFTLEQISQLLAAARKSRYPRRDELVVLFLLDTGCRVFELVSLKRGDLDMIAKHCTIRGKGGKTRKLVFGRETSRALWAYMREDDLGADEPLIVGEGGTRAGEGMTRSGVLQIIERLGKTARIETTRCSPHTFRHTFAVEFLRNGGNVFTLKELLGHTSLTMVNRYVALAQADLEHQHRQFSPVDRMKKRT